MRTKRFGGFLSLVSLLPRPVRILDIGGLNEFWFQRGLADDPDYQITLVNLTAEPERFGNIRSLAGDATKLAFGSKQFDVVFSNSVIEHLFTFDAQRAMADAVPKIAERYWIQTPNYWFPMEPHFLVPGWQWLPRAARIAIIQRMRCGWIGPVPDRAQAEQTVDEIRLLKKRELRSLFPHAQITPERFLGFTKSWVAIGGFERPPQAL